jgi:hypothetical protein
MLLKTELGNEQEEYVQAIKNKWQVSKPAHKRYT